MQRGTNNREITVIFLQLLEKSFSNSANTVGKRKKWPKIMGGGENRF